MSTYLVTGGAGFIGSNIVRKLVADGEDVRVIDNLSTGRKSNLAPFIEKNSEKIEFMEADFTDLEMARKAVAGVDYVLHQGAIPSVPRSVDDPIKTNQTNVLGTLNMLIAARDAGVKRFVYAASSSAYGDSPTMPKEESMKTAPKSPYAIQKLTGEQYCQTFHALYGLETVCLRYFNVFGPNQDPNSPYSAVIPLFIKKMLKGESPMIFGDGEVSRDFTYVDNNISANLLACKADARSAGQVINIACGKEISLNQLVQKINTQLGTNIQPQYAEMRKGDVMHSLGSVDKARDLLNYEVITNFDEGLAKTIEFYRTND